MRSATKLCDVSSCTSAASGVSDGLLVSGSSAACCGSALQLQALLCIALVFVVLMLCVWVSALATPFSTLRKILHCRFEQHGVPAYYSMCLLANDVTVCIRTCRTVHTVSLSRAAAVPVASLVTSACPLSSISPPSRSSNPWPGAPPTSISRVVAICDSFWAYLGPDQPWSESAIWSRPFNLLIVRGSRYNVYGLNSDV